MPEAVYRGRPSLRNFIARLALGTFAFLLAVLLLVPAETRLGGWLFLLASLACVGSAYLKVLSSAFTVTRTHASQRHGLIARRISEVALADVRNIQVNQGVIQRVLEIGDVGISTAGQSGLEVVFRGIAEPQSVADRIRAQRQRTEHP